MITIEERQKKRCAEILELHMMYVGYIQRFLKTSLVEELTEAEWSHIVNVVTAIGLMDQDLEKAQEAALDTPNRVYFEALA